MTNAYALILFNLFILALLGLDLGLFNRRPTLLLFARRLSGTPLAGAGSFLQRRCFLLARAGTGTAIPDRLHPGTVPFDGQVFVFALIFSYMAVPVSSQHRVLFWGILGALVMRSVFIGMGVALVSRFEWVFYLFGASWC